MKAGRRVHGRAFATEDLMPREAWGKTTGASTEAGNRTLRASESGS